jgi:phosphatidylglycerol lysyltransferase
VRGQRSARPQEMCMEQTYRRRILAENIVIAVLACLAGAALAAGFFPAARLSGYFLHLLAMKQMTARVFSIVLLIALYNLYQRKRMAWYITVTLLAFGMARHLLPPRMPVFLAAAGVEAVCLGVLIAFRGDFCCRSERRSVRRGLLALAPAAAAVLLNAALGYHLLKTQLSGAPDRVVWWDSLQEAFGILFGTTNSNAPGFPNVRFENFMFWFSWGCILLALLYALRPWLERVLRTEKDLQRARALVLRYGQNSCSYLTLEDDKLLYFGRGVEGVLPYGVVGNTVIVNGDPVCAPADFPAFLREFRDFCRKSAHKLVFLSINGTFLEVYRQLGFGTVKCGEEACFDLASYDLAGKKGAKMRMNINHAAKAGLTVHEYRPLEQRDPAVEAAMNEITAEWLADKKSGLLTFTMGTVGLDRPMDRRYFYAADPQGRICGYNVYCPYGGGTGYMADITRRTHDAPGGVTEKIMYEAFGVFRAEGVKTVSLGIAPLANLGQDPGGPNGIEKLLNFVYEHLNACYGFKNLYKAKENYSPTAWVPGYYAWLPRVPDPQMFYAMVRIQNPQGIGDFVRAFFHLRPRRTAAEKAAETGKPGEKGKPEEKADG